MRAPASQPAQPTTPPGVASTINQNADSCSPTGDQARHHARLCLIARLCPVDCVDLHTILEFDANGHLWGTRCNQCGMTVDLTVWSNNMIAGSRPWSRWRDDAP